MPVGQSGRISPAGTRFTSSDGHITPTSQAARSLQSPPKSVRTYWKPNRDATDRRQSELRPVAGEMFDLVTARQVRSHWDGCVATFRVAGWWCERIAK